MRLHEGYRKTCLRKGAGACSKLYADFGDVNASDFKTWWQTGDRGLRLFAEPPAPVRVTALTDDEAQKLIADGRDERVLLVAIPLEYRRRVIAKEFNRILDERHGRKPGDKRIKTSRAKYPLAKAFNAGGLITTLKCHQLKLEYPEMPLWQIAQEAGVGTKLDKEELANMKMNEAVSDKKQSLTSAASRKLKIARILIDNVGKGKFPLDEV